MVREGRVLISVATDPDFASSYYVTAYDVGGQVTSGSSGVTATVRSGHGFKVNDKFIVFSGGSYVSGSYNTVSAVNSDGVSLTITAASLSAGDFLINLGADTGIASPNYDGQHVSGESIYTDMAYGTVATNNTVQTDSNGRYRYFHKGIPRWELVRSSLTVPFSIFIDTGASSSESPQTRDMSELATGGSGTVSDPWTGWDVSCVEGYANRFPAGYYSASTLSIAVSTSNAPSKLSLIGDGSGLSIITLTSGTGQLRVRGTSGSPPTVLNCVIRGLNIQPGANNTATGLVSLENFDVGCEVDDLMIDATSAFTLTRGLYILNGENFNCGGIFIRGWSATSGAAGNIATGCEITTNDGVQRGNIGFGYLYLTNVTTGLNVNSTTGGGSIAGISFRTFKAVNSTLVNGTLAISLAANAEQITFLDCHVEKFNNGLANTSVENMVILNSLWASCSNVAVSSGAAITVTNGDGGTILNPRFATVYNGIVYAGTTTRYFASKGTESSVSGASYTDGSSGANTKWNGASVDSAITFASTTTHTGLATFNGRVLASNFLGLGTQVTLTVAANAITVTGSHHVIDTSGGVQTINTINGGSIGDIVLFRNSNATNATFTDSATIQLGANRILSSTTDSLLLVRHDGSTWREIAFADNA